MLRQSTDFLGVDAERFDKRAILSKTATSCLPVEGNCSMWCCDTTVISRAAMHAHAMAIRHTWEYGCQV